MHIGIGGSLSRAEELPEKREKVCERQWERQVEHTRKAADDLKECDQDLRSRLYVMHQRPERLNGVAYAFECRNVIVPTLDLQGHYNDEDEDHHNDDDTRRGPGFAGRARSVAVQLPSALAHPTQRPSVTHCTVALVARHRNRAALAGPRARASEHRGAAVWLEQEAPARCDRDRALT